MEELDADGADHIIMDDDKSNSNTEEQANEDKDDRKPEEGRDPKRNPIFFCPKQNVPRLIQGLCDRILFHDSSSDIYIEPSSWNPGRLDEAQRSRRRGALFRSFSILLDFFEEGESNAPAALEVADEERGFRNMFLAECAAYKFRSCLMNDEAEAFTLLLGKYKRLVWVGARGESES